MSQLVVDSSVVVKWFVVEPYSAEARHILTDYQTGVLTLLAPDLINAGIGNIVWKKHVLQGMDAADAQLCQERAAEITDRLFATAISVCYTTCHRGNANNEIAGAVRCTK